MNVSYHCLPFGKLSTDQLYTMMVLRQEVFVVEQNCPYLDADGRDQEAWHLMGYDPDGQLLAYARLMPKGVTYPHYVAIGRVVTHPSVRGRGLGRELMTVSLQWTQRLWPEVPVKISAQAYLKAFYLSLGFRPTGEYYDEDGIPHMGMVKGGSMEVL